jgi:hypothetical protein
MKNFVCTACHYSGSINPARTSFGMICLWIICCPLAFLIAVCGGGKHKASCPKCNSLAVIPADTPKGQEILKGSGSSDYAAQLLKENTAPPKPDKAMSVMLWILCIIVTAGLVAAALK